MSNYYNRIKNELLNNEIYKKVKDYSKNRNDLRTYYNVGKLLIEAQGGEKRAKYGNGLIKEYSVKLYKETGLNYSDTSLKRMRQFYLIIQKGAPLAHQLTWSHYQELLSLKNINEINYYIREIELYNLSKRQLREKVRSKEYERLPNSTKNKLENNINYEVADFVKDPIIIKNTTGNEIIKEKILQKLILEDLESFMKELGEGFCFIGSEYPIKLGDRYNYIDLLLFNIKYNSYVVIELKVTELKKSHIGQIEVYMNYIDSHLKNMNQNKTIGIIITKENNKYIIKYCSNPKIFVTTYIML